MSKATGKRRKARPKAKPERNTADAMLRARGVDVPALRALEARYSDEALARMAALNARDSEDVRQQVASHLARLRRLRGAVTLDACTAPPAARSLPQGRAASWSSAQSGWTWGPGPELEKLPMQTDFRVDWYPVPSCGYDRYEASTVPLVYEELDPPTTNPLWADVSTLNVDHMSGEPGLTARFRSAMPGAGLFTMARLRLCSDFQVYPIGPGRWCFRPDISLLGQAAWDVLGGPVGGTVELKISTRVAVAEFSAPQQPHNTIDEKEVTILIGRTVGTHAEDIDWSSLGPDGLTVQAQLTGDGRIVLVNTRVILRFYVHQNASADIDFASVPGFGIQHNGLKWGHYRGITKGDYLPPTY